MQVNALTATRLQLMPIKTLTAGEQCIEGGMARMFYRAANARPSVMLKVLLANPLSALQPSSGAI